MKDSKIKSKEAFLVKESKLTNVVAGSILLIVFLVSLGISDKGWANFFYALSLLVIPSAFFFVRFKRNDIIIKIDSTGIYYYGELITSWNDFIDSTLSQKEIIGNYMDNFVLVLQYYDPERTVIYTKEIPLTDTQDKGEEEVLAAIKYYYNSFNKMKHN